MPRFFDWRTFHPGGDIEPRQPVPMRHDAYFFWTERDEHTVTLFVLKLLVRSGPLSITTVAVLTQDAVASALQRSAAEPILSLEGFVPSLCRRLGLMTGSGLLVPANGLARGIHGVDITPLGRVVLKDALEHSTRMPLSDYQQAVLDSVR